MMTRRDRGALIAWALLIALVGIIILAKGAEATRPIHVAPEDKCWNLSGVQSAEEFTYGVVRWKVRTEAKGDCRRRNALVVS